MLNFTRVLRYAGEYRRAMLYNHRPAAVSTPAANELTKRNCTDVWPLIGSLTGSRCRPIANRSRQVLCFLVLPRFCITFPSSSSRRRLVNRSQQRGKQIHNNYKFAFDEISPVIAVTVLCRRTVRGGKSDKSNSVEQ